MPAYQAVAGTDGDIPVLVPDEPQPRRRGRMRMRLEPSADPPDVYATSLAPDAAMAAAAIIAPAGGHAAGGVPGLGAGISN